MAPNLAIVTLSDCDTGVRASLDEELRDLVIATVEATTGRHVAGYLTAHQHDPGLCILAFHFLQSPAL